MQMDMDGCNDGGKSPRRIGWSSRREEHIHAQLKGDRESRDTDGDARALLEKARERHGYHT